MAGSWNGDVGEGGAHAVGGLGHQRRVGGDRDGQDDGALARRASLASLGAGLDRRRARPRRRPGRARSGWRRTNMPCAEARGDQLGQAGVVEADERGHRAVPAAARTPASGGRARGRGGRRRRARGHRRRRAPSTGPSSGRRRRPGAARRPRRRPSARASRRGYAIEVGEERRLGVLGEVELLGRAVPGERG